MYPGVELRVMRYFLAVQAELHFTRAAERVHVAQPSLSKQIRNLEDELGVTLFKRSRRGVELTPPGEAFAENARQSLLYAERAAAQARAVGAGTHGKLLMGISPAVDTALLFRIRDAFHRQYPDLQIETVCAFATELAEMLMRSDLHVGLIELPIRYSGLDVMNIAREPTALVLPANQIQSPTQVTPERIQDRTLVLVSERADLAYQKFLAGLKSWGYRPPSIQPVLTAAQALDFVGAGNGVAAVRTSVRKLHTKGISYCLVEDLPWLDAAIAYRRNIRTPVVRNFLEVVRREFSEERNKMRAEGLNRHY